MSSQDETRPGTPEGSRPIFVDSPFVMCSTVRTPILALMAAVVCMAAMAASGCTHDAAPAPPAPAIRRVVLITIDTLRADRVGVYGGAAHTPNIDAVARSGVWFTRAYAA